MRTPVHIALVLYSCILVASCSHDATDKDGLMVKQFVAALSEQDKEFLASRSARDASPKYQTLLDLLNRTDVPSADPLARIPADAILELADYGLLSKPPEKLVRESYLFWWFASRASNEIQTSESLEVRTAKNRALLVIALHMQQLPNAMRMPHSGWLSAILNRYYLNLSGYMSDQELNSLGYTRSELEALLEKAKRKPKRKPGTDEN